MIIKKPTKKNILWIAVVLITISFVLKEFLADTLITTCFMLVTALLAGIPVFKKALVALRYKIIGIDALVTIAVVGAVLIGEYWEAAAVTFLFMLGDYLESRTIEKTRSSIKTLLDQAPVKARVRKGSQEIEVRPEEVMKGDHVIVKPGEKISVDGTILEGSGYIDQSAITGEPLPVNRGVNEHVFSGTIIESGYLIISAEKVGDDTTFAKILELVEDAQDSKAKTQQFLERFSRFYTPAIILLSLSLYLVTKDIVLALTLLVIACPGALVISAPVSIVAGIGNGARSGVIVKGGEIMEKLGTVKVIAFDKTGTLTYGKPSVAGIQAFGIKEREVLRIAAAGESYSEHPLAKAIIQKAGEVSGPGKSLPEKSEIITGKGLSFTLDSVRYYLGNRKLMMDQSIRIDEIEEQILSQERKGHTQVLLANSEKILGIITIADRVRGDAKNAVSKLKSVGIRHIVMLTGDNDRSAKAISNELGLDEYFSELLPEDKVRVLRDLQEKYGRTAMVGDGVNDAPALASSDLGIAMGAAGSDVAIETADVVLMSSELDKLSYVIGLSRSTVRNMRQNIYFALLVASLLLAGVLVRSVHLSFGMLVHEFSVLLVIINAVRLTGYKEKSR
ncbi:cadmium-translocating P-type ATPase [Oceanispirochaeta crateris]|uniref:P-type Zn(2+) transporter n=1 Tax=Oceanispirochaeta crateris TaxID=2518645 RepID=A0A5C1QNL9_9SPIO|nr:cation-translocating P-type ATPase [Oceanispirochaeta crateris]QEN08938.1 cadmium-translocating P-type ATPase [Oceanispirochaeta crateris]